MRSKRTNREERETADVSLVRCSDYSRENVQTAVRRAVDCLGGMSAFVKRGDRVLIKPNLLKAKPPDAAVTTHPEVVRAVIRLVHDAGGIAFVGDSPGFGDLEAVCEKSGILEAVREEGACLASFEEAVTIRNTGQFHRFEVARTVRDADVLINLPKFKTHGMTTLTGAVKNLFGCIPGKRKVQWHFNTGVNHEQFMRMLVELSAILNPGLTLLDAVVGMEGNGPGSGDPRPIGYVVAGPDPVAVDVISGLLVGVSPERLPVIRAADAAGIGTSDPACIRVVGDVPMPVALDDFRLPPREHLEWRLPEWARRSLKSAFTIKPVIHHASCAGCGICQTHCPQGAIESRKKKFIIHYRDCIRCFCCQEFCPKGAITVGRGWLLRLLP